MPTKREAPMRRRYKTSLVMDRDLWIKLKVAAMEEGTDASALLSRLAEEYLKSRKGGRR